VDVEYWATFDPTVVEGARELRLDAYRTVRDGLWDRIAARFPGPPTPAP
ncbi:MAG: low molecular weight phosphatase family protein, partial [Alphaproteobacteria bacterium]|nr:low molecular weight phosphatase family protein [Alphaproteobacteria bacterium]